MGLKESLTHVGLMSAYDFAMKDPEHNIPKLMDFLDKHLDKDYFSRQRKMISRVLADSDDVWHKYIFHLIENTDPGVLRTFYQNFFVNDTLLGWKTQQKYRDKYNCNIPWGILLDPTSACNLHCTGCWAAEYGNKLNLTLEEIDSIIKQGNELGCYLFIYTGGEPLVRKNDLIRLCEMHPDCEFLCFTNATLIDEKFADEMLRVKNFVPAISLEGFEEATDGRRGDGVYQKVVHAMEILKSKKLPFGLSCCYTSKNMDSITSEEYIDSVIEKGALFAWYFHYMPVGKDAAPELLPSPEQRVEIYHRLRGFRVRKPLFILDFQNDGEYVGGCIAGGHRYMHINANGDCDPCVFIHYSDSNIREKTLLEALRAPLFQAYHDSQPFNENHLRPCPMLENPEKIREIISKTGVKSTELEAPETAEELTSRTNSYAANWAPTAAELWKENRTAKAARLAEIEAQEKAEAEAAAKK